MPATVTYEGSPKLNRTAVRQWANALAAGPADRFSFGCLIAPAERLRVLNRDFRHKDESTDVLSFPAFLGPNEIYGGGAAGTVPYRGDLAISIAHARAQARALGHPVETEIAVLMLHGVLHLMGMDHETDRGQMRRAESRWRKKLGLPAGLTERAGPA
jgi:probable rRNA maturation factor